jgi:hypothetical protein
MRPGGGKAKGSAFERCFCKTLSLWWSDGEADDLFYRTASSGARATVRGRQGKGTRGHCGDVCATDSEGEPLTRVITFELKRGHNGYTIQDLLDKSSRMAEQVYEKWFTQAGIAACNAGSYTWAVVVKRDQREPLIIMPTRPALKIFPSVVACVHARMSVRGFEVAVVPLGSFLAYTKVDDVKKIARSV